MTTIETLPVDPAIAKVLDHICRERTGFRDFAELVRAKGGYRPTIDCTDPLLEFLAECYDRVQEMTGDPRRAERRTS